MSCSCNHGYDHDHNDRNDHHENRSRAGKIKIFTQAHPCGVYVTESKAKYAVSIGLASCERVPPRDSCGVSLCEKQKAYKYCVDGVVKSCHSKPCHPKPCHPKPCQPDPCCDPCPPKCPPKCPNPVSVECDLQFKLLTSYSGCTVTDGQIVLADPVKHLNLCCDTAKLHLDLKADVKRVLLGIPLLHTHECYVYTLVPPEIADANLSSTTYADNLVVTDLVTGSVLPVGMQVSNGYLYIEIDVEGKAVVDHCRCTSTLMLCFSTFKFELKEKVNCCKVDCKPVTWESTCPVNPIVEDEDITTTVAPTTVAPTTAAPTTAAPTTTVPV